MKICPYITASLMQRYPDEDSIFKNYATISNFLLTIETSKDIDMFEKLIESEFDSIESNELCDVYYSISCKAEKCGRYKACCIEGKEE